MKKALAIVLALVMALSVSAIAFAEETTTAAAHYNTCPICGTAEFKDEKAYNDHLCICSELNAAPAETTKKDYVDLTVKDILNAIIDLAKSSMGQWDKVEDVVLAIIDLIQNMGDKVVGTAEVEGAIANLESMKIPGAADLINALKQKIKDLYACEEATTVEETTAAEAAPETGSASTGIAVFAAVSVAAAAAYVCTKKRA